MIDMSGVLLELRRVIYQWNLTDPIHLNIKDGVVDILVTRKDQPQWLKAFDLNPALAEDRACACGTKFARVPFISHGSIAGSPIRIRAYDLISTAEYGLLHTIGGQR